MKYCIKVSHANDTQESESHCRSNYVEYPLELTSNTPVPDDQPKPYKLRL